MGVDMVDELPDRYDRQVRLWGEQGQRSIGQTNVAVIGSSALATEILKSLILAGIGSYKIFDEEKVHESDTGNNFFVTRDDIQKMRGEVATKLLNELNPSVKGEFVLRSFTTTSSLSVLNGFSLVVGVRLPMDTAEYLSNYLYERNIPFVWATTAGLIGYFRLSYRDHEILHDHRELPPHDFRLQNPFPEFKRFVDGVDLENMKHEQHSHIPYVILLLKTLEAWRAQIGDPTALPREFKQRKEFTSILMGMQKLNEHGIYNEDNFEEAKQQVIKSFSGIELNENVRKLFNDPRSDSNSMENDQEQLSSFWIYVSAIKLFYTQHGYLPLSGSLPDMVSDTNTYTTLVNLFRNQAIEEAREVHQYVTELSKMQKFDGISVSFTETVNYCKNASRLSSVTGTNLADELANGIQTAFIQLVREVEENFVHESDRLQENENGASKQLEVSPLVWLILLRASEHFYKSKNRHPGTNGVPCHIDAGDLSGRVKLLLDHTKDARLVSNLKDLVPDYAVEEFCRYGNSELNVTASILGGVISQEIIKLCTQQYVPVDNTFVFDGNTQKSVSIRL